MQTINLNSNEQTFPSLIVEVNNVSTIQKMLHPGICVEIDSK